jgi:hypothetical protein
MKRTAAVIPQRRLAPSSRRLPEQLHLKRLLDGTGDKLPISPRP